MSVRKKVLITVIVLAILGGLGFGIYKLISLGAEEKSNDQAVYVQTVSEISGKGLWGQVNRYAGTVESPESWSYTLRSGGKVKEVYVRVGDTVQRGQKLLAYDTTEEESSMEEAKIELERMEAEIEKSKKNIETLEQAIEKAEESDKTPLEIELENEKLELKKADMQIASKKKEIKALEDYTESPVVTSKMDGVVTVVNNGASESYFENTESDAFITVVKVGDYRIKASVNEMNINDIAESAPVIVTSRVDDSTWTGIIETIEREQPDANTDQFQESTTYPFYIALDSCEGLMLGQHVYVEVDRGQYSTEAREGIWISDSYIVDIDLDTPYVYADNGLGVLEKRAVALGERDEALKQSQITAGIGLTDKIAIPMDYVKEGLPTSTDITALMNQHDSVTPAGGTDLPGTESAPASMPETAYDDDMGFGGAFGYGDGEGTIIGGDDAGMGFGGNGVLGDGDEALALAGGNEI